MLSKCMTCKGHLLFMDFILISQLVLSKSLQPVIYNLTVSSEKPDVLPEPTVDIEKKGSVPNTPSSESNS